MSRITFRDVAARIAKEALADLPEGTTYQEAQRALDQVSPLQSGNAAETRIWMEERKKAARQWRDERLALKEIPKGFFG